MRRSTQRRYGGRFRPSGKRSEDVLGLGSAEQTEMGRIRQPELRDLADKWKPTVHELLDEMGRRTWRPKKERNWLFGETRVILRHSLEGPLPRGDAVAWALSHTSIPSSFDAQGTLSEGLREYWILSLELGPPPTFRIEGAESITNIPADERSLRQALVRARKQGPKVESFYGNKGPLSHR